jgi:vacuolar-type H+-ATPase subunit I/STV1
METQQEAAAPVADKITIAPEQTPEATSDAPQEAKTDDTPQKTGEEIVRELEDGINIDGLAKADLDDPVLKSDENYKVKYDEVVSALPEDGKKIVANLRSSYTKKTQEMAELKRDLEKERESVAAQRQALFDSENYKKLEEQAKKDPNEWDPYSRESFESRVQQEVARQMKNVLEPMREKQELQKRQNELRRFKEENPDLTEYKTEIVGLLKQNTHLSLEDAYWQVKGQKLAAQQKEEAAELSRYKKAAKAAGLKVGGASRGSASGIPKYVLDQDDPVAIYNWLKENKTKGRR